MTVSCDAAHWLAHAQIQKFRASDERDAMHTLFPRRARLIDKAAQKGFTLPQRLTPHIEAGHMLGLNMEPFAVEDYAGNLLVTAGLTRLMSLLIGGGGQAYDNTHAAIGAGDTNTAAAITDTDLAAAVNASNRYIQVADSTFPSVATNVMTTKATFATGNGNFAWAEWIISQNTSSGANAATAAVLNRKVVALGTKTSAAAWAFTVTITIS